MYIKQTRLTNSEIQLNLYKKKKASAAAVSATVSAEAAAGAAAAAAGGAGGGGWRRWWRVAAPGGAGGGWRRQVAAAAAAGGASMNNSTNVSTMSRDPMYITKHKAHVSPCPTFHIGLHLANLLNLITTPRTNNTTTTTKNIHYFKIHFLIRVHFWSSIPEHIWLERRNASPESTLRTPQRRSWKAESHFNSINSINDNLLNYYLIKSN